MTPQQHAHAQALNEAHIFFGGRPEPGASCDSWWDYREDWVLRREHQLAENAARTPAAQTPVRSTT